jgi:alpha-glucosidase (family GH31 glycosyl hydrolase)
MLLFLLICLLQTSLIYFHHFSPFERESNLRAVLWGAKPAPRYWAVVVLDLCTGLLLALLVLSLWPQVPGAAPLARLVCLLPAWLGVALLSATAHHWLNEAIIRFPRYDMIARRALLALAVGAVTVAATLLTLALAATANPGTAFGVWGQTLPALLLPVLLLALAVFVLRALAFFLRVLPLVGDFGHAAASTLLLVWLLERYGRMLGQAAGGLVWPAGSGLEGLTIGVGALALVALGLAWRLPGAEKHADAVEPPPLVVGKPEAVAPAINFTEAGATMTSGQVRVEVTRSPFAVVVKNSRGDVLWQLADNGLRHDVLLQKIISIPFLYTGNTIKFKWRAWSQPISPVTGIEIDGDALVVTLRNATLRLSFHANDVLRLQVCHSSLVPRSSSLVFLAPDDAHYLGFGQRFNKVDQRGEEPYFFVEEGGVGYAGLRPILKHIFGERGSFPNGEQCTGFPVPFCLISREHGPTIGLFWNTYQPSWVSVAGRRDEGLRTKDESPSSFVFRPSSPDVTRLTVLDNRLDCYLCAGPTALEAMRQYTALTGRPNVPPPWVLLPWKTRTGPVTEADVQEDMQKFRELDIPLAQVGVEHWQEIRGSYEFSPRWYPHIDQVIAQAKANGYRITIWHFPYMNAGAATHRQGVQRGYFLRNRLGLPYQQRIFHGIATVVDYSNPEAAAWHEAIVQKTFYERGFHGAMTDYAESIPPDCVFYNGQSGLAMRNAYPVLYVQAMQRAARAVLGDDYLIYPRAGYAATQRFVTVQWPGDQDTDWDDGDGLPAAVRAMLNVSMCGFPVHGSDIGGWYDWFTPPTTKELFLRWAEVGAYSPLMRAHGGPIGRNREPWKFDQETVEIYRALSQEHVKLFPYLYSLAIEAARTGAPIIRHPSLLWPARAELYQVEDAWLIGEALYVAPVVRPGLRQRQVVLPPGEWWSLTENRPVRGPARLVVEAPFGRVPCFLRRGFLLPRFARAFDTFDDPTKEIGPSSFVLRPPTVGSLDDDLEVWLYPGEGVASCTLFDGSDLRAEIGGDKQILGGSAIQKRRVAWRLYGPDGGAA